MSTYERKLKRWYYVRTVYLQYIGVPITVLLYTVQYSVVRSVSTYCVYECIYAVLDWYTVSCREGRAVERSVEINTRKMRRLVYLENLSDGKRNTTLNLPHCHL